MLATYAYDDLGNRTGATFLNGASQGYGFDSVSRLTSLSNELAGTANDLAKSFAYNPASQIVSETKSNDAYAFLPAAASETGIANGLNQLTQYAGKSLTHDGKGNVTAFGGDSYTYSSENLLKTATVAGVLTTLQYDPLLRLYQTNSTGIPVARFAYDGLNALAEYNSSGVLQRRWVFDPTTGQPVVWYEGTGTGATAKRYLSADERGSIISVSDSNGASLGINSYDEYGIPAAGNLGRYGYTGQAWLGAAKLWYLNARMYGPTVGGTFLQPDPIGYAGGINLYAYTGGDPVNFVDPLGLAQALATFSGRVQCHVEVNDAMKIVGFYYCGAPGEVVVLGRRPDRGGGIPSWLPSPRRPAITDPIDTKLGIGPGRPSRWPIKPKQANAPPQDWCGSTGSEGVPDGNWGEACKAHDECYGTPGAIKEVCDAKLSLDITAACSGKIFVPAICALPGVLYGGGLMILGWTPFWHPSRDAYNAAQGR